MSCMHTDLEKQSVFRANHLIRVRSVSCFLSILWVCSWPISGGSGWRYLEYVPQHPYQREKCHMGRRAASTLRKPYRHEFLRQTPGRHHADDQWHAIASAAALYSEQHSTFHLVRRCQPSGRPQARCQQILVTSPRH
jgi:hypothetical protein